MSMEKSQFEEIGIRIEKKVWSAQMDAVAWFTTDAPLFHPLQTRLSHQQRYKLGYLKSTSLLFVFLKRASLVSINRKEAASNKCDGGLVVLARSKVSDGGSSLSKSRKATF